MACADCTERALSVGLSCGHGTARFPSVIFTARWSASLIIVSVITTGICVGAGYAVVRVQPLIGALVFALPVIALLFCVRGYTLEQSTLLVKRLLWNTEIPLHGLRSAEADPALLAGSLRTFGNGGFFSFSGWFYSRKLGKYRAFMTDRRDTVVLTFDDRTVVVSPQPADRFAARVLEIAR